MNVNRAKTHASGQAGKKAAARGLALLVLLSLTLLSGCFDYELELTFKEDGSGTISAILVTPDTADAPPAKLMDILLPEQVRKRAVVGKRMVTKDTSAFDHLDAVAVNGFSVGVKETSFGVLGMTDHTYRVTFSLYPVEGDRPDRKVLPGTEREIRPPDPEPTDPALKRSRKMVGAGLKGNYLIVTFRMPGEIRDPLPLTLGSSLIKPELSQGKSRVSWKIPWSVLINEDISHTMKFVADFKGDLEFRVPGQLDIATHPPTEAELAQVEAAKKAAEEAKKQKDEAKGTETGKDDAKGKNPPPTGAEPTPGAAK